MDIKAAETGRIQIVKPNVGNISKPYQHNLIIGKFSVERLTGILGEQLRKNISVDESKIEYNKRFNLEDNKNGM